MTLSTHRLLAVSAVVLSFANSGFAQNAPIKSKPADQGLQFVPRRDAFGNVVWRVQPNQSIAPTTETGPATIPSLTFEVYQDDFRQYRWRMNGPGGRTMAAAVESYKTRDEATQMIETIMTGAKLAKIEDKTK